MFSLDAGQRERTEGSTQLVPAQERSLSAGPGARLNPAIGPGSASGPAPFVIRYFPGSAGSGVKRRDGLAQLDPAGLVYYG